MTGIFFDVPLFGDVSLHPFVIFMMFLAIILWLTI